MYCTLALATTVNENPHCSPSKLSVSHCQIIADSSLLPPTSSGCPLLLSPCHCIAVVAVASPAVVAVNLALPVPRCCGLGCELVVVAAAAGVVVAAEVVLTPLVAVVVVVRVTAALAGPWGRLVVRVHPATTTTLRQCHANHDTSGSNSGEALNHDDNRVKNGDNGTRKAASNARRPQASKSTCNGNDNSDAADDTAPRQWHANYDTSGNNSGEALNDDNRVKNGDNGTRKAASNARRPQASKLARNGNGSNATSQRRRGGQ
ncbi:hypothetical protein EDB84DRAFT_1443610 [Lactarius hengduanensis]|nr:hypothetical protein EDB84DRAFT_1443610 [Lactarius hengduanensis]